MSKVNQKPAFSKPKKPYDGFPLFPHATGRWAKKIRGKFHYFGRWDDPNSALQKYLDERDDLYAGRSPRAPADGLTIRDLLNRFLTSKQLLLDTGEIANRTFLDYRTTCQHIADAFGLVRLVDDLVCDDFEKLRTKLAKRRGPVALGNEVQRVRSVFKYCYDAGLIDKPVRFGPVFKKPSRKVMRQARNAKSPRMLEAHELRALINTASVQLRTMIFLGINCGFGNSDVAKLPKTALDLESGWVNFPRPKTGIRRRCPLWPETIAALETALTKRPSAKNASNDEFVFITKYGEPWANGKPSSPVSQETTKVLKTLGIHRPGLSFYALRHTFETIAGESRDQVAVDHIMGHARDDMASVYRERISDQRLKDVTECVRSWLFAPSG